MMKSRPSLFSFNDIEKIHKLNRSISAEVRSRLADNRPIVERMDKTDEESDVIMYQQLVRGLERYLRLFKPETRETVRMYVLDEIPMEKAVDTVSKRYRCDAEDLQKRVNNALRMMKHNR